MDKLYENKQKCAVLLQKMLDGILLPQDVKKLWPVNESHDHDLSCAFHLLQHFIDDNDIRLRDKRYQKWQKDQIKEYIELFRN